MASLFCPIYTVESGFWEKIGVQGPFFSVPSRTWISEQYAASVWFGPTGPCLNPTTETMLFKGTTMQKIHCQVNPGQAET